MMTQLSDNSEWNRGEEFDDEDEEKDIGAGCLDRLALSIKDPVITVLFSENAIPAMLSHADWKVRHAAILAISLVGEGCVGIMKKNLDNILQFILPGFQDPHERVRWAACNTIGQMSTDFCPTLQKRYHQQILTALCSVMGDSQNPRVQSYAAAAIINFCDECKPHILYPYLDPLLTNLISLVSCNQEIVVEQAIIAVAAIADCAGEKFQKVCFSFSFLLNFY